MELAPGIFLGTAQRADQGKDLADQLATDRTENTNHACT